MNNQKLAINLNRKLAISVFYSSVFYTALAVCFIFLVGCESSKSPNVVNKNVATLKDQGEKIGTLPDGRSIYRYEIKRGALDSSHWIYVVSDGSSVTNNSHVNKANHVEVLIDGVKYTPLPQAEKE